MKVAEFLLGSLPLLIQFYADFYRKIDFENTMYELESEFNVPQIKTYDFIIGEYRNFHVISKICWIATVPSVSELLVIVVVFIQCIQCTYMRWMKVVKKQINKKKYWPS